MASQRMRELTAKLNAAPMVHPDESVTAQRTNFDNMDATFVLAPDVTVIPAEVGGVLCDWISVAGVRDDYVCVYLHGGGYAIGSRRSHREVASRYGRALNARTLLVEYRRAPEYPCPAQLDDAVAVYDALLESGVEPQKIAVCGESAGGGLTIALLTELVRTGRRIPAVAAVVSPWVDLTLSGDSLAENDRSDPVVVREVIERYRDWVCAGLASDDPRVSPAHGDLAGLPPTFVTASNSEMLRDDARLLVDRLTAAGVPVAADILDEALHAWTLFPYLPESRRTVEQVAAFASAAWDAADA